MAYQRNCLKDMKKKRGKEEEKKTTWTTAKTSHKVFNFTLYSGVSLSF